MDPQEKLQALQKALNEIWAAAKAAAQPLEDEILQLNQQLEEATAVGFLLVTTGQSSRVFPIPTDGVVYDESQDSSWRWAAENGGVTITEIPPRVFGDEHTKEMVYANGETQRLYITDLGETTFRRFPTRNAAEAAMSRPA